MLTAIERLTRTAFFEEINNVFRKCNEKFYGTEKCEILIANAGIRFSPSFFSIHLAGETANV